MGSPNHHHHHHLCTACCSPEQNQSRSIGGALMCSESGFCHHRNCCDRPSTKEAFWMTCLAHRQHASANQSSPRVENRCLACSLLVCSLLACSLLACSLLA